MKMIAKFTLTALAGVMLVACGSSGNKDGKFETVRDERGMLVPKPAYPNLSGQTVSVQPSNEGTGGVYIVSYLDRNRKLERKVLNNADDLNVMIVDGEKIPVVNQDKDSEQDGWNLLSYSKRSCCSNFSSMRFGYLGSENEDEKDYFFYNGKPTQDMPTSGKASYTGHFAITGNIRQFKDEDYLIGTAKFDVDFGNKQLKGVLTEKTLMPINIEAKMNGNAFAGNAGSPEFNSKATVEGKFFGKGAKELGGIFKNNALSWGGSFGATK